MSDERLRELERAWRASRSPADEAALLRARLQAGLADAAKLRLAAVLGHGPAREALDEDVPRVEASLASMKELLVPELAESGGEAIARAARTVLHLVPASPGRFADNLVLLRTAADEAIRSGRVDGPEPARDMRGWRDEQVPFELTATNIFTTVRDVLRHGPTRQVQVMLIASFGGATQFPVSEADLLRRLATDLVPWLTGSAEGRGGPQKF